MNKHKLQVSLGIVLLMVSLFAVTNFIHIRDCYSHNSGYPVRWGITQGCQVYEGKWVQAEVSQ